MSLQLSLNIHWFGFQERIYTPHISWVKATEANLQDYKDALGRHLKRIDIPVDVLIVQ